MTLSALLRELTVPHVLDNGHKAYTYVVEWQKRAVPHAYILSIFKNNSKIRTPEDIDNIVCAIPDENTEKRLLEIITSCMIHEPCDSSCLDISEFLYTSR